MSRSYAKGTEVSVRQSRDEIEATLDRFGADQFMFYNEAGQAAIAFRLNGRMVRIFLPLPHDSEQDKKERWRSLALTIKAKCAAADRGISTIEREFLADIVLADGRTFGQWAAPQVDRMYLNGNMPPLLLAGPQEAKDV